MEERRWRMCQDCKKAIFDPEEDVCFRCGSSNFKEITKSQLLKMRKENPESGIIIKTRHWGEIL